MNIVDRFLKYVKIDTKSDENSVSFPSDKNVFALAEILYQELKEMGIKDVKLDNYGYVMAYIPGDENRKKVGFIAHMDTSPDAKGNNINPSIIRDYKGDSIPLDSTHSLDTIQFPNLKSYLHHDLIVTDGSTLLGADDKAGVAEIMEAISHVLSSNLPHGDIYIAFTPDEEVGQGVKHFDYDFFKADFAYTLDGDKVGGVEYENFNAASSKVEAFGKTVHPGSAKGKMVNALKLLIEFNSMLPVFMAPENTELYEGFNHLMHMNGATDYASSSYIIRNHDLAKFEEQKESFQSIKNFMDKKYGYECIKVTTKDSYHNMFEIMKDHQEIIDIAYNAIKMANVKPYSLPIRGGTDGANLSFKGLPCPNLGTGGGNYHGIYEYCSINEMYKAVEIICNIIELM